MGEFIRKVPRWIWLLLAGLASLSIYKEFGHIQIARERLADTYIEVFPATRSSYEALLWDSQLKLYTSIFLLMVFCCLAIVSYLRGRRASQL